MILLHYTVIFFLPLVYLIYLQGLCTSIIFKACVPRLFSRIVYLVYFQGLCTSFIFKACVPRLFSRLVYLVYFPGFHIQSKLFIFKNMIHDVISRVQNTEVHLHREQIIRFMSLSRTNPCAIQIIVNKQGVQIFLVGLKVFASVSRIYFTICQLFKIATTYTL